MKKTILIILYLLLLVPAISLPATASDDPPLTLSLAIQHALANNPAVERSRADEAGAGYAEKRARADFFPRLTADYTYTSLDQAPYMITAGREVQVAHSTQYQWGVSLVQPLFTGWATSARHAMARLDVNVKEKERQQTVLDIAKGVKSAFYQLLLNQKMRVVTDEAMDTLASHEKDARMFFRRGIIRQNDLLRAQVALADAVQARERARADVAAARADLNRWLACDINADTRITDIDTVTCGHYRLDALIAKGLKSRPQLQAMALVRETLVHAITLEKSGYYPTLSAVGRYWQSGDSPEAGNNDYENDHNAALVLQATWTWFDANRTRAQVGKATADKRAYDQSIRQVEDLVRLEIKRAYLDLGVAENNIASATLAVSQAEENMRITRLGYRQEAATSTEVLDAQSDLTRAKTHYYQALYGYLDALATLERAVGQEITDEPDIRQHS